MVGFLPFTLMRLCFTAKSVLISPNLLLTTFASGYSGLSSYFPLPTFCSTHGQTPSTRKAKVRCSAQLLMGETEIVGTSNQVHPGMQRIKAMSRMPAFAGQSRQPFAHRPIEAKSYGRIELVASHGLLQKVLCMCQGSPAQLARHLHHPFLFSAFDHCGDTEIRPDL
jgi:hypothetical protein